MVLKPTHLVVTPFAYAKGAPPAAGGLTRCYVPGRVVLAFVFLSMLLPLQASADQSLQQTYLAFEQAYFSNDASTLKPWLDRDYKLVETLHVPGMGNDSRSLNRRQLLAAISGMRTANSSKGSNSDGVKITSQTDGFCASSSVDGEATVGGARYDEREDRQVCFVKYNGGYRARSHSIDVYYKKL